MIWNNKISLLSDSFCKWREVSRSFDYERDNVLGHTLPYDYKATGILIGTHLEGPFEDFRNLYIYIHV